MGCKSAVALVRGVEYCRSKACSAAQVFLQGDFWKGLAHFFFSSCRMASGGCAVIWHLPAAIPWKMGLWPPHSIFPVFLVSSMEELPSEHHGEAVSTRFSTLCITASNRGPFDVERV